MQAEATARVFFALWPDAQVSGRLAEAAQAARRGCGGRPTRRETIHLTLAFVGPVALSRLDALRAAAADTSGLPGGELRLDRLGYWKHNRIVWAGSSVESTALAGLARRLGESLGAAGFPVERRPFAAHLTLIRHARCTGELPEIEPIVWAPRELLLVESALDADGARYSPLARWPLG